MSAELQSMLKFQAERMASGGITAEQFQELARRHLELDRQARSACLNQVGEPLVFPARLQIAGELSPGQ